jgi:hypothetical protein
MSRTRIVARQVGEITEEGVENRKKQVYFEENKEMLKGMQCLSAPISRRNREA